MQVEFSEIAKISLKENIDFLEINWTNKEINAFLDEVDELTEILKKGNYRQFQKYSQNIWSALIGKRHVRVYFKKEDKNLIKILLYFHAQMNPTKLLELLINQ